MTSCITSALNVSAWEVKVVKITVVRFGEEMELERRFVACLWTFVMDSWPKEQEPHRKDLKAVQQMLLLLDSSDSDFSSDEEALEILYLELSFKPKKVLGRRPNFEELSMLECERLFRQEYLQVSRRGVIAKA